MQLDDSDIARLASALAIPKSRPRLYEPDGSNHLSDEWCPSVEEAVQTGRPFVIALRDAVVGIDFDPEEVSPGAFAAALFLLSEEGLPYIRTSSGREGHEHVFVVLPAWQRADRLVVRLVDECGLPKAAIRWKGYGTFMRPPLAPHRSGLAVALVQPETIEAAIDLATPRLILPTPTRHIIDVEQYESAQQNRSKLKARVMTGAVAGDVCFEFLQDVLWKDQGPIGAKIREQGYDDIERSWRDFQDYVAKNPPKRAGYVAGAIDAIERAAVAFKDWRPQTAHNDRAVLSALCQTARMAGTLEFTAARRTLALRAGVEPKTLSESLKRLERFGFVKVVGETALLSERGSFLYKLRNPMNHSTPDKGLILSIEREVTYWRQVEPSHDAFAPKALGKQGWLILASIPDEGATAETIARLCGYKSPGSTRKHLLKMMQFGVVECDESGTWRVVPEPDLDVVAKRCGTLGRATGMADRYAKERSDRDESRRSWARQTRRSA